MLSIEQIADYFGVCKATFYKAMSDNPQIGIRYKKGKAKAIGSIGQGLMKQARDGNTSAMMFYLKCQAGWKENQKMKAGTVTIPKELEIKDLPKIGSEIFRAITNGEILPEQGKMLMDMLKQQGESLERNDMEERLRKLEAEKG